MTGVDNVQTTYKIINNKLYIYPIIRNETDEIEVNIALQDYKLFKCETLTYDKNNKIDIINSFEIIDLTKVIAHGDYVYFFADGVIQRQNKYDYQIDYIRRTYPDHIVVDAERKVFTRLKDIGFIDKNLNLPDSFWKFPEAYGRNVSKSLIKSAFEHLYESNHKATLIDFIEYISNKLYKTINLAEVDITRIYNLFVLKIGKVTPLKYTGNQSKYKDGFTIEVSIKKMTRNTQLECFRIIKQMLNKQVLDKLNSARTFIVNGLPLNYYKMDIAITNESTLVYRFTLKLNECTI